MLFPAISPAPPFPASERENAPHTFFLRSFSPKPYCGAVERIRVSKGRAGMPFALSQAAKISSA